MNTEEFVDLLNQNFKNETDNRVSKPDIWICSENNEKNIIWNTSWTLKIEKVVATMNKPNDVALYSNLSDKKSAEAKKFYLNKILPYVKNSPSIYIDKENQSDFYDYFEMVISAIIFAYTSMEALSNILIPENFTTTVKKNNVITNINKFEIEKTFCIVNKFKLISKEILKGKAPTAEKWWFNFTKLKDIRDEIIHSKPSKSEDRYTSFLDSKVFELIETHKNVIHFYGECILQSDNGNLFRNDFPYGFGCDKIQHLAITEAFYDTTKEELINPK